MEPMQTRLGCAGEGSASSVITEPLAFANGAPGLEHSITSEAVLALLAIPQTGLLRIHSALLFAGNNELCAYWWREAYDGQQHVKLCDPIHVKNAFANEVIDSGYLPANVIRLGINQHLQWLALSISPASYALTLLDEQQRPATITLGLPGIVLFGHKTRYWIWAIKDAAVTPQTHVFHLPLPNIGADGTLCFGANTPPQAEGPTMMQALYLFMNSPFNDHWAANKAQTHTGDIRVFLHTLVAQGHTVFPEQELVPITFSTGPKRTVTLDEIIHHARRSA